MGQKSREKKERVVLAQRQGMPVPKAVTSLLDAMQDGNEYGSIVGLQSTQPDLIPELRRALAEIELVRGRPCVCYLANMIKDLPEKGITAADHLPFDEMISQVDPSQRGVDVLLATPGGSAETVNFFVDMLRRRFDSVEFIVPYQAMSAGTLWALSGDRIWMDERAFLGPIDPQVPASDGRFVPAGSLLTLLNFIQKGIEDALKKGQQPPQTLLQLLRNMDQRALGSALSMAKYVSDLAAQYLERYKFKDWTIHQTHNPGSPVTSEERHARAVECAEALASHQRWMAHGHLISRQVLWEELHIKIDRPEEIPGLARAVRRTWALACYIFDKAPVAKMICSRKYSHIRNQFVVQMQQGSPR